jgi:enoyl-CoA hydratase
MSKVDYRKRDRIGYVTLNRPDALNALDDELNDALWDVSERLRKFIGKSG